MKCPAAVITVLAAVITVWVVRIIRMDIWREMSYHWWETCSYPRKFTPNPRQLSSCLHASSLKLNKCRQIPALWASTTCTSRYINKRPRSVTPFKKSSIWLQTLQKVAPIIHQSLIEKQLWKIIRRPIISKGADWPQKSH